MAESESGQEKTEEPTAKRLQDAREKGDIARSKELTTTVLLMAAAAGLMVFGTQIAADLEGMMKYNFALSRQDVFDPALIFRHLGDSAAEMLWSLSGFFLMVVIAALVGPTALGGWNFSSQALAPKFSRINPLAGLKRMFSMKALVELAKALAKFLLVGALCVLILLQQQNDLLAMGYEAVVPAMKHGMEVFGWAFLLMCATLILIAAVDVPFQLYDHNKKLKMTLQEVKDEMKNTEGKPEVKGRIRQLQREMSQRRMMGEVPEADVVITNPTHFSVALKYAEGGEGAPVLVAKGQDQIALKIREVAREHEVAIVEAPALARALYFNTELDEEIPESLFVAVAQVLAYVYQLKRYRQHRGPRPGDLGEIPVPSELRQE
ncbi:flagellar biosynthesis protein FlhB [Motiliproteus sp. SC1-56]|uniref:flagellar biosynthesis protein FlhB n=1 Tax=Motiliproteus sp. SC1-56 TaxID=2799565 RepID=UPI001A8D33BF